MEKGEYEAIMNASRALVRGAHEEALYRAAVENYDAYMEAALRHLRQYAEEQMLDLARFHQATFDMNRHLLNYLSSIRTFLDHSETRLKRKYGEDSEQVKTFCDACSREYDGVFAYRFLYRLRNYTQHCGMPISNIHFDSTVVGPAGNEARHKLVMWCSRDDLLRNFKGWGPQVRRELAAHPELFDITPYLNETLTCLRRIEIVVLKEDVPELVEFAHYLHQLVAEVARDGFRAVILSRGGANETRLEHLPLHVVDHFLAAAFPGRYPPVNQAVRFGLGNITVTRRTAE